MKRAISLMMAVALASSFMFAGSAAALDISQSTDQDAELEQDAEADLEQEQYVSQSNAGQQGGNVALADDGGSATAGNSMSQTNYNLQYGESTATNIGVVDQDAENDFEFDFSW